MQSVNSEIHKLSGSPFFNCSNFDLDLRNAEENLEQFSVSEIIVFELVAVNSHYYQENSCHRQSIRQETVLRFQTSLRETFTNSISLRVMRKHEKSVVVMILALFGTLWHVGYGTVF